MVMGEMDARDGKDRQVTKKYKKTAPLPDKMWLQTNHADTGVILCHSWECSLCRVLIPTTASPFCVVDGI